METINTHLAAIAKLGVLRHFKAGAMILRAGDSGDAVYLMRVGSVRSLSQSLDGKEIVHNTIHAGAYFGEMALDGGPRSSSVEAMTDCECYVVPNSQVLAYAKDHSEFALHLLNTAIARARHATDAARDMALLNVYTRLTHLLRLEFEQNSGACDLTHAQLAASIGSSREMVSKLIKDLVRGGYVEIQKRSIILKKKLPAKW